MERFLLGISGVAQLNRLPARPRLRARKPLYPRALGLGLLAVLSACGGNVERDGSPSGGDSLGNQPGKGAETGGTGGSTAKPTPPSSGGSGGSGGDPWGGGFPGGAGAGGWDEDAGFGGSSTEPEPSELDAAVE